MARSRPTIDTGPGLTKQSHARDCDINHIINQYDRTGVLTHVRKGEPLYMDVSEIGSYREALDNVRAVERHFMGLPPELRQSFDNDPAAYLDWVGSASEADLQARLEGSEAPVTALTDSPDPVVPSGEPEVLEGD